MIMKNNWNVQYVCNFGLGALGRRSLGRCKHRWADNIKIELKETSCALNWIQLAKLGYDGFQIA
jgi:hypothetical protein